MSKKVVFFTHPGRTASYFLKNYLKHMLKPNGWYVRWEEEPYSMHNSRNDLPELFKGLGYRQGRIERFSKGMIETNHAFIKNFYKEAIDLFGDQVRLVYIVRDPLEVAVSYTNRNTGPRWTGGDYGNNPLTYVFHLSEGVFIPFNENWNLFQRNLWEWFEVYLQGISLEHQVGKDKTFYWSYKDIITQDHSSYYKFLKWIGHETNEKLPLPCHKDFEKDNTPQETKKPTVVTDEHKQWAKEWYFSLENDHQTWIKILMQFFKIKNLVRQPYFFEEDKPKLKTQL